MEQHLLSKFTFPSLLSYAGSIKPGAAFYDAVVQEIDSKDNTVEKRVPVEVTETTIRGTMANYKEVREARNPSDTSKCMGRANIQVINQALLPANTIGFQASFVLTIYPNALKYHACNDVSIGNKLNRFVERYMELGGARYIAERYVTNLLRGTWMWRNATQFESGVVSVTARIDGKDQTFVNNDLSPYSSMVPTAGSEKLIDAVAQTLSGKNASAVTGFAKCLNLRVVAVMDAYPGQEVFPSQEFTSKEVKSQSGSSLSRVLASVKSPEGVKQAIMHPQKIGNALRRIDDWYQPIEGFALSPLPVEPLGVDSSSHVAHRATRKNDFFTLLENQFPELMLKLENAGSADDIEPDHHYVVSVLIRGGVFSGDKKAK